MNIFVNLSFRALDVLDILLTARDLLYKDRNNASSPQVTSVLNEICQLANSENSLLPSMLRGYCIAIIKPGGHDLSLNEMILNGLFPEVVPFNDVVDVVIFCDKHLDYLNGEIKSISERRRIFDTEEYKKNLAYHPELKFLLETIAVVAEVIRGRQRGSSNSHILQQFLEDFTRALVKEQIFSLNFIYLGEFVTLIKRHGDTLIVGLTEGKDKTAILHLIRDDWQYKVKKALAVGERKWSVNFAARLAALYPQFINSFTSTEVKKMCQEMINVLKKAESSFDRLAGFGASLKSEYFPVQILVAPESEASSLFKVYPLADKDMALDPIPENNSQQLQGFFAPIAADSKEGEVLSSVENLLFDSQEMAELLSPTEQVLEWLATQPSGEGQNVSQASVTKSAQPKLTAADLFSNLSTDCLSFAHGMFWQFPFFNQPMQSRNPHLQTASYVSATSSTSTIYSAASASTMASSAASSATASKAPQESAQQADPFGNLASLVTSLKDELGRGENIVEADMPKAPPQMRR